MLLTHVCLAQVGEEGVVVPPSPLTETEQAIENIERLEQEFEKVMGELKLKEALMKEAVSISEKYKKQALSYKKVLQHVTELEGECLAMKEKHEQECSSNSCSNQRRKDQQDSQIKCQDGVDKRISSIGNITKALSELKADVERLISKATKAKDDAAPLERIADTIREEIRFWEQKLPGNVASATNPQDENLQIPEQR